MRIASLQPSISLTLAALGRLDALCAVTKYCVEALPELGERGVPVLHDSWTADTREIVATRPDLVMTSVPYRMESLAAILKAGVPVLALAPHALSDVFADMRLIAAVVRADAEPVVAAMQEAIEAARSRTAPLAPEVRPRVYCEEWGKPMIRSQRWVAELLDAAGGRFLGEPGAHTTPEEVASADPDLLLFAWCGAGDRVPLERVIAQRGWEQLRAVRDGRVYCIPDEYLNTPAPTLLEGLDCLAAAVHPRLFSAHPRLIALGGSLK
jgi:iron complex transport system substrate-binding protein